MLDLPALTPNAADLEIVPVGRNRVIVSHQHVVVVFPISPQHADGQQDEQDEDASASDRHCDSSRFEPQIVSSVSNCLSVSKQSGFHGDRSRFLNAC